MELQIPCKYTDEEDARKPASKSYVDSLRNRIRILEQVLRSNSIEVNAAIAALGAKALSKEQGDSIALFDTGTADAEEWQDLCTAFEGALSLDEALNFEEDGEARYFGPSSSRLELQPLDGGPSFFICPRPNIYADEICRLVYAGQSSSPGHADIPSNYALPLSRAELYGRMLATDDEYGVPEHLKEELVDLFFTWQNPWMLVVDEHLFRESRRTQGRYYSPLLENCIWVSGVASQTRLRYAPIRMMRIQQGGCSTKRRNNYSTSTYSFPVLRQSSLCLYSAVFMW